MYLGTSKYWWAYLALRTNPELRKRLQAGQGGAVLFDDPGRLPARDSASHSSTRFFYVLWDGIVDSPALDRAAELTSGSQGMTLLTVGDQLRIPSAAFEVQSFFGGGDVTAASDAVHYDGRTTRVLALSRARNAAMPLKNLRQSGVRNGLELLTGRRRLVFCGSYGLSPETLRQLCERHGTDPSQVREFPFFAEPLESPKEPYAAFLAQASHLLASLAQQQLIGVGFLFTAVHLLGREYALRQMHASGLPLFVNGYATGVNINVYTTPWYRQHVFPDFGSAVGSGMYPRLADLRYYRKRVVAMEMVRSSPEAAAAVAAGDLESYFRSHWQVYEPALRQALQV